jgi:hypothetical protein
MSIVKFVMIAGAIIGVLILLLFVYILNPFGVSNPLVNPQTDMTTGSGEIVNTLDICMSGFTY